MIRSMTAFAREEAQDGWGAATWELKSVNYRYLEVAVRLPEELRGLEPRARERAGGRLTRGKLDCVLRFWPPAEAASELTLNMSLVEGLVKAGRRIGALLPPPAGTLPVVEVLRWPGVVEGSTPDLEGLAPALLELLDAALVSLIATREREGAKIAALIATRLDEVDAIVGRVRERLPLVRDAFRDRLASRLAEFAERLDPDRLEQEVVLFANKMDVAEELDRLEAHTGEVRRVLAEEEPAGRRLDFLMQEMNREANTLGAKSVDSETTRASVDLKVLIEQMREQIQNVE